MGGISLVCQMFDCAICKKKRLVAGDRYIVMAVGMQLHDAYRKNTFP